MCIRGLLLFVLVLHQSLFSQNCDYRFEHLNTSDGLTQNSIQQIIQDDEDYIWIATEDGLNRYDGYSIRPSWADPFDTNSIVSNYMHRECIKDSEGNLWFTYAVENGISKYLGDGKFRNYKFSIDDSVYFPGGRPFIEDKTKNLWITLRDSSRVKGLAILNLINGQSRTYSLEELGINNNLITFYNIYVDQKNNLWLLSSNGIYLFSDNRFSKVSFNLPGKSPEEYYSIYEVKEDIFLISTKSGIVKYNRLDNHAEYRYKMTDTEPEANRVLEFIEEDNDAVLVVFKKKRVFRLKNDLLNKADDFNFSMGEQLGYFEDSRHRKWIFNKDRAEGITVIAESSKRCKLLNNPSLAYSLIDNKIRTVFEDKDGNIYIGTEQKGISILFADKNKFKWLVHSTGYSNSLSGKTITSLSTEDNNIIIGQGKSGVDIYSYSDNITKHYNNLEFEGNKVLITQALSVDKEKLLIGTRTSGLFIYNIKSSSFVPVNLNSSNSNEALRKNIKKLYHDSSNRFWIGTTGGLFVLDAELKQLETYSPGDKLSNQDIIFNIIEHDGKIIAGTQDGIIFIETGKGIVKHIKHDAKSRTSLSNHTVFSLYVDSKGILWAGTFGQGLNRIDTLTDSIKHYTINDGLPNNTVNSIIEDSNGYLWMGTGRGLSRFNPESENFRNYFTEDGLPGNDFNRSCTVGPNGNFYFGTDNGLLIFNPESINLHTTPPTVKLTGFNILNDRIKSGKEIKSNNEITISYKDEIFSFDFIGINISAPQKVRYAYKLEGLNEDWTDAGIVRKAIFTNVPPGSYLFRVKACNEDGSWSDGRAYASLVITPPYWQTIWFRILMLLAIAALLYGIYLYRIRQLKKIEKMRLKIAGDLHDEIGSNLGSIAIMSKTLKRKFDKDTIDKIFNTSLKSSSAIRDIVWFINPENDETNKIIYKMKSYCEDMLEGIEYKFDMKDQSLFNELSLEKKRNIYLVLKEAVHNVVKHADASEVKIRFYKNHKNFVLEISDNGMGFENREKDGSGLGSMHKRATEINATLTINSVAGKGTEIMLEL